MMNAHKSEPIRDGIVLTLTDRRLHCTLSRQISSGAEVTWTLHRGDFNPRRASEPVISGPEWSVELPDRTNGYCVRAVVEGVTWQSTWIQYFDSDTRIRYSEWRDEWSQKEHPTPDPVPLFRYEAPFQNIGFVCSATDVSGSLGPLARENGLMLESHRGVHWTHLTILMTEASRTDRFGKLFAFSGISRNSERLLFGSSDVASYVRNISKLRDEIGEYHLLSWDEERITFEHDYIGQGHIYYYADEHILAAANGVHLLVLMLRSMGVPLRVEVPQAQVKFFSTSYPFEYEQSTMTDFVGVRRLSVFERLEVKSDGPDVCKTELWFDDHDGNLTSGMYENLLSQAKSDIIDNIRIALKHPRFENVVVELSAGLDSRIIYSALTNLPPSGKVRISTRPGSEESTAAAINNLYQYEWDDLAMTHSFDREEGVSLPTTSHSVFMDGYYIESMFKSRDNYSSPTLLLTGHGGEAFSRVMSIDGYYARDFSGELPQVPEGVDDVKSNVVRCIGNHQIWIEVGEKYFEHFLRSSLEESPSRVFGKEFADIYLAQRNPFVGGSVFRGAMSAPQWRPLQSKALFRLRSRWFSHQQDFRLQFDLIRTLNPLIGEVPYLKPLEHAWQREYERFRPAFGLGGSIPFDRSNAAVEQARAAKERSSKWRPSRREYDLLRKKAWRFEESAESFLEPLGQILTMAPELEEMGLPLFSYVHRVMTRSNRRAFSKRHNVRNKLHILMQELLIMRYSWNRTSSDGAERSDDIARS